MASIETFKDHIIDAGVIVDPEGIHHELYSGMHGQKADFDVVETGTPLFDEWIDVNEEFLRSAYPQLPEVVIGVANGTNRLAVHTAQRFEDTRGAESEKDPSDPLTLRLSEAAFQLCALWRPELVVVLEDVSTTGGNSVQVARRASAAGARSVEVVTTWQRRQQLERLAAHNIVHRAIINSPLPTYTLEECQATGFCAQGWQLIPHLGRSALSNPHVAAQ